MSKSRMFGLMKGVPCKKPAGELKRNSLRRFRAEDGVLYHQYFGPGSTVYNTDGERWYRLTLHMPAVRARFPHMRSAGKPA